MEIKLDIKDLFGNEQEMRDTVRKRRICYDSEPYYINRKSSLVQIGFQLNLYGTFQVKTGEETPDDPEFVDVLNDVKKLASVMSFTCGTLHMCESAITDSNSITYAAERGMRPDVTVHIPIYDQKNFGHPVDDETRKALDLACKLLESVGVRKKSWRE